MEKQYQYNSVEEALEELRRGRIVLVTDDPDRENEGDMQLRRISILWHAMRKG